MNYDNINEKLSSGQPILLDGGIGTEVMRRGVRWRQHGIEDAPDVIRDIHVDYLDAGVDVLTTHTFNLTPLAGGRGGGRMTSIFNPLRPRRQGNHKIVLSAALASDLLKINQGIWTY